MQNLQNELINILQHEDALVVDGQLNKNKIVEMALQVDPQLIKHLIKHDTFKTHFFTDVEGVLVFDKIKFQRFVNNKSFLPDSYTAFKNKIGLTINDGTTDNYITTKNDVVLAWPHKDCVLEGGQTKEDQKRNEIFWNETLAPDEIDRLLDPKVFTNWKKYDQHGEHEVTEISDKDNLIIKGNNLLAISSLKKKYKGQIKLIYIDPPYNTKGDANTFLYNNTFNHSTWLAFMRERLIISRELLKSDGVIAIAIDDEEQAYLKVLCDEIFGRDNFIGNLVVQIKPSGRTTDAYFATSHEYVLFYSKVPNQPNMNFFSLTDEQKSKYKEGEGDNLFKWRDFLRTGGYSTPKERPNSFYPIYYNPDLNDISLENKGSNYIEILPIDTSGAKRVWRKTPPSFKTHRDAGEIQISKRENGTYKVQLIDRIKNGVRPKSMWYDSKYDASSHGTKLLKKIFEGNSPFSFPKSIHAVKDVIELFTENGGDDIVLDFFAGSGTTGHAVLELNKNDEGSRKFILCEQLDYVESITTERIIRVIKELGSMESFKVLELAKYNQEYSNKILEADSKEKLIEVWLEMKETAFLSYQFDKQIFDERIEAFKTLSLDDQKKFLLEVLDKNQLYVNYSEMADETFGISKEDKRLNDMFYGKI